MKKVKCFDILTSVTDEFTKRLSGFSDLFVEDKARKLYIGETCQMFHTFVNDYDVSSFEAEIDEHTMEIVISIVCSEFETMGNNTLSKLSERANEITFSKFNDEIVKIDFRFDGIWVKRT